MNIDIEICSLFFLSSFLFATKEVKDLFSFLVLLLSYQISFYENLNVILIMLEKEHYYLLSLSDIIDYSIETAVVLCWSHLSFASSFFVPVQPTTSEQEASQEANKKRTRSE